MVLLIVKMVHAFTTPSSKKVQPDLAMARGGHSAEDARTQKKREETEHEQQQAEGYNAARIENQKYKKLRQKYSLLLTIAASKSRNKYTQKKGEIRTYSI